MSKSQLDKADNEIFSNSEEANGHHSSKHFDSSAQIYLTPSDTHPSIRPTLDSHGFEFIEDGLDSENTSNNDSSLNIKSENNQDISSLILKNNSNQPRFIKRPKSYSIKILALTLAIFITLGLIISLSMPNQVKNYLQNNTLFNKFSPEFSTPAYNEHQDINENADNTQTDEGLMPLSKSQKLSQQESLTTDFKEIPDGSSTILNTNPEADPDVQEAINMAVGKELDTSVYSQSTNNYYEFLRASETPLLIEETPPKTLYDEFDTTEKPNEEIHVDNDF